MTGFRGNQLELADLVPIYGPANYLYRNRFEEEKPLTLEDALDTLRVFSLLAYNGLVVGGLAYLVNH